MTTESYVPFGPEWEKEISNLTKPVLIKLVAGIIRKKSEEVDKLKMQLSHYKALAERMTELIEFLPNRITMTDTDWVIFESLSNQLNTIKQQV